MTQGVANLKKPARPALGRGLSALVSTLPNGVANQIEGTSDDRAQEKPLPLKVEGATSQAKPTVAPPSNADSVNEAYLETKTTELSTASSTAYPQPVQSVDNHDKQLISISISQLRANPNQPRQDFSDQEVAELAESIKTLGILQPIVVRPLPGATGPATYQVVAGERRFRAAIRAGLSQVPVIIKDLSEKETLEVGLVENIQRQGLNPIEEALGFQRLIDDFSLSTNEVGERVGKDRATVANALRLLKLPQVIRDMVRDGRISVGHAKAILTVREPNAQIGLANKIISEGLSVRSIESIVARDVVLEGPKRNQSGEGPGVPISSQGSATRSAPPPYPELEERLRNALGTKVTITKRRRGGTIELQYFSDEELDRLIAQLAG
jgi:ParB family chromosome partitioning protein